MNDSENKLIPASTVLIIRNGKKGIEVFMVVRHHEIDFASGLLYSLVVRSIKMIMI